MDMASRRSRNQRDRRAPQRESDEPDTWEALLAAERERSARRTPATDDDVPDSGQEGG